MGGGPAWGGWGSAGGSVKGLSLLLALCHVVLSGFSSVYFVSWHFAHFSNLCLGHEASGHRWCETNVHPGSRAQDPGLHSPGHHLFWPGPHPRGAPPGCTVGAIGEGRKEGRSDGHCSLVDSGSCCPGEVASPDRRQPLWGRQAASVGEADSLLCLLPSQQEHAQVFTDGVISSISL